MEPFRHCLNASTLRGTPVLRQVAVARQAGYGAIELWFDDTDAALASGVPLQDLRRALDDAGLEVPTMIYLAGWMECPEEGWPALQEGFRSRLDQAAQLGARHVILSPAEGAADVPRCGRRYRELLALGRSFGVLPSLEFLGFAGTFCTIESLRPVLEAAADPDGTVVVDPFHVFRGGGSPEALAGLTARQVAISHFNDAPSVPARERQHDADRVWPGAGHLDLGRYLRLLRGTGYAGWLSLELFREDLWRRDPLEVAREGLDRMRAVVEAADLRRPADGPGH